MVNLKDQCKLKKPSREEKECTLKTENVGLFRDSNLNERLELMYGNVLQEFEDLKTKGSGWSLEKIQGMEVAINQYDPLHSGSYTALRPKYKVSIMLNKSTFLPYRSNQVRSTS